MSDFLRCSTETKMSEFFKDSRKCQECQKILRRKITKISETFDELFYHFQCSETMELHEILNFLSDIFDLRSIFRHFCAQ